MMPSYTVKCTPLKDPKSSLLGFADVIVADTFLITGFKIWKNKEGHLFATLPSNPQISGKDEQGHLIQKTNEAGVAQYQDSIRFIDAKEKEGDKQTPLQKELLASILEEWRGGGSPTPASSATPTPPPATQKPVKSGGSSTARSNPLWGG